MTAEAGSEVDAAPRPPSGRRPRRHVSVPLILQMEAVECGAAALAMVLAYHGRIVPLEELRVACGVSRDGSKAVNVVKAARAFGLEAKGQRLELEDLIEAPLPAILYWRFNHFVTLTGHDRAGWYINDPAQGRRFIPNAEFDTAFTGVALVMEPGATFEPGGSRPSLVGALWPRIASSKGDVLYMIVAAFSAVSLGLVVPALSRAFVDRVLVNGFADWVMPLILGMAASALFAGALTAFQTYVYCRLAAKLSVTASTKFMNHVLHLPMEFFTQRFPGDITGRVGMNNSLSQLVTGELTGTAVSLVTAVFYAWLMFNTDRVLGAAVTCSGLFTVLVYYIRRTPQKERSLKIVTANSKMTGTEIGGLQSIETIKGAGGEMEFFQTWSGYMARKVNAVQEAATAALGLAVIPGLISGCASIAILSIGGLRVMEGRLTLGDLVAFQGVAAAFLGPFLGLATLAGRVQEAGTIVDRVDDVLRYPIDDTVRHAREAEPEGPVKLVGALELRDITYGYSKLDNALIEGLSITLHPGTRVALVGGSGSGKSTVARLIAGLLKPWSGQVLFDGRTRDELPAALIQNSVAFVDQDVVLFEGTVRENLTLWDESVSDADIVRAAQDAMIEPVILDRQGGYDARIEEGGRNYSGGQSQRLEIARALASNPSLLILDEATSALDPVTEKQIDNHLRRRGCTCVIVAHRLSTIRDCDEIIVLERGKVVERGTHADLVAKAGTYHALVKAQ